MNRLENYLHQLEAKIPYSETMNQAVSQGNVAWHIEHTLLTLSAISSALAESNPKNYTWRFSLMRIVVFSMGKIPKGRAKAPAVVQPKGVIDTHSLSKHLALTTKKVKDLAHLSKDAYFEHPFFGELKLKQAIYFLEIHTKHHLKIIGDILKK